MTLIPEEEARAAAYRAQLYARRAFRIGLAADLQGDPAALAALRDNWTPLIRATKESQGNVTGQQEDRERGTGNWHEVE